MIASSSAAISAGARSVSSVDTYSRTHSRAGRSIWDRSRSRRRAISSGGSEPAQPAYAAVSTRLCGISGRRR
jgi:hypothetical protein